MSKNRSKVSFSQMQVASRKLKLEIPSHNPDVFVPPSFVQRGSPFDTYEIIGQKGEGSFGRVFEVKSRLRGTPKAIKILDVNEYSNPCLISKLLNEATIGMQMKHSNIIGTDEVFYDGSCFYFVMDLITPISSTDLLGSTTKSKIMMFQQLFYAVMQIHSQGFLHRDIKIQNTGVKPSEDGEQLCLFDFGESCQISHHYTECVGTVFNLAPEVVDSCKYSRSSELWTMMCYLVEILTGKPLILHLFDESNINMKQIQVLLKISSLTEAPIPAVFKTDESAYGKLLLQILERGLAINPEERLTFPELEHLLQDLLHLL